MTHPDRTIDDIVAADGADLDLLPPDPPQATDRTIAVWVTLVGAAFCVVIYACVASLAILTALFHGQVAQGGDKILAPLLGLVAIVPVLGILVFEFAYARALAGLRYIRAPAATRVYAICGLLTFLVLAVVHPFVPLAGLTATGLGVFSLVVIAKLRRKELFWDFLVSEATPILTGRDQTGLALASLPAREHALAASVVLAFGSAAFIGSFGVSSFLTTTGILTDSAIAALALLNSLAAVSVLSFVRTWLAGPENRLRPDASVTGQPPPSETESPPYIHVHNLSVTQPDGRLLLDSLSFVIESGQMLAITGETGAGKSLLLSALSDPFSLYELETTGTVRINGMDPWRREKSAFLVPTVHLPEQPLILPASGADNLACFQDGAVLHHAKRHLEHLTFSSEMAEDICATRDAQTLPDMQRRLLAFARAFNVAPSLYLLDRPENGLSEKQMGMLLSRFENEKRLGRSLLIITENRRLLEACDTLMVLQNGRMVDFGNARDIRDRQASGWARFVGQRSLEIEENLENWIRSHFKRPGDEANRRKAALLASEMLALSCQQGGADLVTQKFVLEFKHFVGHCLLRMQDADAPFTTATLRKAQNEAARKPAGSKLSPLATLFSVASDVETSAGFERRVLTVKLETYDPRIAKPAPTHAQSSA